MRNKLEEFKQRDMRVFATKMELHDQEFIEFLLKIDEIIRDYPIIKDNLSIYFEKNHNKKNIICFKLRGNKNLAVFSSKTVIKNDLQKTFVKIEGREGEWGFEIAKKVARFIIPFFQNVANSEIQLAPYIKVVQLVDYRTKKINVTKVKGKSFEKKQQI